MTRFLLWLVRKLNRYKNRCLAEYLLIMARDYDPDTDKYDGVIVGMIDRHGRKIDTFFATEEST